MSEEALKERYRNAMPLLVELLRMQRLFTGEVKLVSDSGQVNARALGYIYGLADAAFQIGGLDSRSQYGLGVVMALIAEFDEPRADMLWNYLKHPDDEQALMDGASLGFDDYRQFDKSKGAAGAPPMRWMKCFPKGC
jgi:hypothetical protein